MPTIFIALLRLLLRGIFIYLSEGHRRLWLQPFGVKVLLTVLFWSCALAFVVSMLARNVKYPDVMAHTIHEGGNRLAGFTLYMVLFLVAFDIFKLFNGSFKYGFYISLLLTLSLLSYGYYHYQHPKTQVFNISYQQGCQQ